MGNLSDMSFRSCKAKNPIGVFPIQCSQFTVGHSVFRDGSDKVGGVGCVPPPRSSFHYSAKAQCLSLPVILHSSDSNLRSRGVFHFSLV